jgi:hypothetical protein
VAQRVDVVLIDDIDPEQGADETVQFALDGIAYEIDLSEPHAKELRAALDAFVAAGRRVGGRKKTSSTPAPAAVSGPSAAEVRAWAVEQGYEIPNRGRIPADVREAYDAAH